MGVITRWRASRLLEGDVDDGEHSDSHVQSWVYADFVCCVADDGVAIDPDRYRPVPAYFLGLIHVVGGAGCAGWVVTHVQRRDEWGVVVINCLADDGIVVCADRH